VDADLLADSKLLAAKRDLDLPTKLRKLDNYELVILDDIGYVKQTAEEDEVLFTLLAERYERPPTVLTSSLVFSEWDRIVKNRMATSAATRERWFTHDHRGPALPHRLADVLISG